MSAVENRRPLRAAAFPIAAVLTSLMVGYGLVTHTRAVVALAILPVAVVAFTRRMWAFAAAVLVATAIPHSASHVWLLPPLLIGCAAIVDGRLFNVRLTRADAAFVLLLGWMFAGWVAHPELAVPTKELVQTLAAFAFYAAARFAIQRRAELLRALWIVMAAGTVGAASVLLEWVNGSVIFSDPSQYQWGGGGGEIYRPGGVFGGSPAAAIALSMIGLATLPLIRSRRRRTVILCQAVIWVAVFGTYARAGWVGATCGAILLAVLLPYRNKAKLIYLFAVAAILIVSLAQHRLSNTAIYREGVVRPGSTSGRLVLLRDAWPLATDSPSHFVVGRGFRAFMHPEFGIHDDLSRQDFLILRWGGPHNTYLATVLEHGIVGLALLLGWLVFPLRKAIRLSRRFAPSTDDRFLVAALAAAAVVLLVAGLFHDLIHNVQDMTVGALLLGLLVSATQILSPPPGAASPSSAPGKRPA